MDYPKIETLYDRDEKTHKVTGRYRLPEFAIPSKWLVTEKIDGTNVRIVLHPPGEQPGSVTYGGRTESAQMPVHLVNMLQARFTYEVVSAAFDPDTRAIIYGEGYGPKIQKGSDYRSDVGFRVFDVVVFGQGGRPWWLNFSDVVNVAHNIGADTVPVLAEGVSLAEAVGRVNLLSAVAREEKQSDTTLVQEGIVCRTDPLLFCRTGERLMWKLKVRDL